VQLKDGIQYFDVPDTGKYRIEAAGILINDLNKFRDLFKFFLG